MGLCSLYNLTMPKEKNLSPFFHHTWASTSSSTPTKPLSRNTQFPFSKHSLCIAQSSAARSQHSSAIREGSTEMSCARQHRFPKPCPAHDSTIHSKDTGAAQQDSCLHIGRKRPISIQQQILEILCNFIPAVGDYEAFFSPLLCNGIQEAEKWETI